MSKIRQWVNNNKGIATIAVCVLGIYSMYVSNGQTGIGWAILGVFLIWGC